MSISIGVVDYDLGNVRSILNALEKLGFTTVFSKEGETLFQTNALIIPGVGAFNKGIENLQKFHLVDTIKDFAKSGKPLIGICLGMHILFDESEEFGVTKGLGLISGKVAKLPVKFEKLPHMAWSRISCPENTTWEQTILSGVKNDSDVYFCHSYAVLPKDQKVELAYTQYGVVRYSSVVQQKNIYGIQFHPEKSGQIGLGILENLRIIS